MKKTHPIHIIQKKAKNEKISMLTAYEYSMAKLIDRANVDMILVGDSLGNVFAGHESTLPVTMAQMIYHTQAVVRGAKSSLVVADMPFLSVQVSIEDAKRNAGLLIKEGGAQAIKIEVGPKSVDTVQAIIEMGIPVMAHLGFTPQSIYQLGGYRVQGRSQKDSEIMLALAKKMEEIGCFSVLLEMVPQKLSQEMTNMLSIPTIGIGAGAECDGQVLVTQDILGLSDSSPKFVKQYVDLKSQISSAISSYKSDVESGTFPDESHSFN